MYGQAFPFLYVRVHENSGSANKAMLMGQNMDGNARFSETHEHACCCGWWWWFCIKPCLVTCTSSPLRLHAAPSLSSSLPPCLSKQPLHTSMLVISRHAGVLVQMLVLSMTATTAQQWDTFKMQLLLCWQQVYGPLFWIVSAIYLMLESTKQSTKASAIQQYDHEDDVYCNVKFSLDCPSEYSTPPLQHWQDRMEEQQPVTVDNTPETGNSQQQQQQQQRLNARRKSLKVIVGDHMQYLGTRLAKRRQSLFAKGDHQPKRIFCRRSSAPAAASMHTTYQSDDIPVHPLQSLEPKKRKHKSKIFAFFTGNKRKVQPFRWRRPHSRLFSPTFCTTYNVIGTSKKFCKNHTPCYRSSHVSCFLRFVASSPIRLELLWPVGKQGPNLPEDMNIALSTGLLW